MRVRDVIEIQNNKVGNREKATLLTRLMKARARKNNPIDTDTPIGWNATPYAGSAGRNGSGI